MCILCPHIIIFACIYSQEEFKAQLNSLQVKLDLLETKNSENEAKLNPISSNNAKQEEKIIELKAENSKLEIDQPILSERDLNNNSSGNSSTKALLPSSCGDLSLNGHSFGGLYLVQNSNTSKIQTVFCDFANNGK